MTVKDTHAYTVKFLYRTCFEISDKTYKIGFIVYLIIAGEKYTNQFNKKLIY